MDENWAVQAQIQSDNYLSQHSKFSQHIGYNCHMIDIAQRSDYDIIKPLFDSQLRNLKCPDGSFRWGMPLNSELGHLIVFEDSRRGIKYLTRIYGIEPIQEDSPLLFINSISVICIKP